MRRKFRTAFSTLAVLTACLAPPALTRTEREALTRAIRNSSKIEVRNRRKDFQSHEAFAILVLGLDFSWKLVVATLSVPLSQRLRKSGYRG